MRIDNIRELGIAPVLDRTLLGFLDTERIETELVTRAEREFARVHGVPDSHAMTGVSNGTDALKVALEALNIGYGDAVMVPGLTWQATAGAVLDVNAVPVLIDINPDTLCLSADATEDYLARCVSQRIPLPKAMIPAHLFNHAADLDRFVSMAIRHDLFLIEDCAQAHGATWNNQPLGTFGTMASFSTQRTKPLSGLSRPGEERWECPTGSEGGYVLTGVPILDQRTRALASCGRQVDTSQIDPNASVNPVTGHWREKVDALELAPYPLQSDNNRLPASVAERHLDQLQRFNREHDERVAGMRALDQALATVLGIRVLPRQPQLTRPNAHMYAFRFDPDAFAGMDSELFRQLLMHLLGGYLVDIPYHPLGGGPAGYRSPVYNPQTKQRYRINEEHWAAIDPRQWHLPNAHAAAKHIVVLEGTALRERSIAPALTQALTWMQVNAATLTAQAH